MHTDTITNAIRQVLSQKMRIPRIAAFHAQAKLNEDLYLDSVLVLELLLNLETELGIQIPDTALSKEDFDSVENLAVFLLRDCLSSNNAEAATEVKATTAVVEEFEDIKVHCFVSCLCEIIKADDRVDHRPFYFGVWDAEVVVDKDYILSYHSDDINHDFFRHWYQKLYGVAVDPWYEPNNNKADNINTLLRLLDNKPDTQQVMVMLDMYRLPERENKYNQNPFPHYVLLETSEDPQSWFMSDPDFRWEGKLPKAQILDAIASPAVAGGYSFNSNEIRCSSKQDIRDYFLACLNSDCNPMTNSVRDIVQAYTQASEPAMQLSKLADALKQLPVLAIRKYAYEHGLAYFWRELNLDDDEFESWCDEIEKLVDSYRMIQFRAMKIAQSLTIDSIPADLLCEIETLLQQQDEREFRIKARLLQVFEQWQQLIFDSEETEQTLSTAEPSQ